MKIAAAWERYDRTSTRTSDQSRFLAMAGIVAVWLFTGTGQGDLDKIVGTPRGFILALMFFALTIAADLLQYMVSSILLHHWIRAKEVEQLPRNREIAEVADYVSIAPRWLYYIKVALLLAGYATFALTTGSAYFDSL